MLDWVGERLRVGFNSGWDAFDYVIKHETETMRQGNSDDEGKIHLSNNSISRETH